MQGINFVGGSQDSSSASSAPIQRPKGWNKALMAVALIAVAGLVGSWWWVNSTVPVSSFELKANGGDAVGVPTDTTFTLTSNNDLDADTVKAHVTSRPAVEFDVKKKGRGEYELTPVAGLPENRVLAIGIDTEISDQDYGWAFTVKAPMTIVTAIPRNQGTMIPLNSAIELTFNRSGIREPERFISIEPAVQVRFESDGYNVTLVPLANLKPSTVYTVTVKAGLGAEDTSDEIAKDAVISFETASTGPTYSYESYVNLDRTFWDYPIDREPVFGVRAGTAVTQLRASVYRFSDAAQFIDGYNRIMRPQWGWSQYNRVSSETLPEGQRIWDGSVPVERGELSQSIRIPQQLGQGFYAARITRPGVEQEPTIVWFQMTPIASYLTVSGEKSLVALRSTVSGDPVKDATVSIAGKKLATTGSDGVALFQTPSQLVSDPTESGGFYWGAASNFLTVEGAGTTLIVPVESQYGWYWRITPPEQFWSYISEDKTIYQPSDTVRFWGVVKQRNGDEMRGKTVTVSIEDGYWFEGDIGAENSTVYARTTATISDFYTLTGSLNLAGLEPRTYQLVVRMGNEVVISDTITVQAYVKPAYKIELVPSAVTMFAGNPLTFSVKAAFFDGTPVDRLAVKYDGWDGSGARFEGSLRLDAQGAGTFTIQVPYRQQDYWPSYLSMRVSPQKAEEGDVSTTTWVNTFGPAVYLNVNQERRNKGASEHFDLKVRSVDLEAARQGIWFDPDRDKSMPNHSVSVQVTEISYFRDQTGTGYDPINKTTYPVYTYRDERRVVATPTLTTDGTGGVSFDYDLVDEKGYLFDFTTTDESGRREVQRRYAYRTSWAWGLGSRQGVAIRQPGDYRTTYKIGDEIEAEMYELAGGDLPQEKGRYLFIRLVNGLQSYAAQDTALYRDSFKDEYVPNVQILGVYFDGTRFVDTMPANYTFEAKDRRLTIDVQSDKDRYKPGEPAALSIKVTDIKGNPVSAEVNVSALDEAVFSLNPDNRDFLTNLYRGVYTPILTRSSHQEAVNAAGAERGGCFLAGTQILMPEGSRAIEDIRVGDEVLTLDATGALIAQSVVRTSAHMVRGYLSINERLRVSANHRIWIAGEWKEAGQIRMGDMLTDATGASVLVTSVRSIEDRVRVYNFEVQPAHTYIADGIWVHNEEKGGGEVRSDFKDQALYTSVRTAGDGRANVTFPLPDNITSWRVTLQAVTRDLKAGTQIEMIPVGLPFFVDATLNRTYLTGDRPIIRVRTFGTEVPERATYRVDAPTLPAGSKEAAGERQAEFDLGELPGGVHELVIGAKNGALSDALKKSVRVVPSYFARRASGLYELRDDLQRIDGTVDGYTGLTFMSLERGKVYSTLAGLSWGNGSRLDAILANRGASLLLRDSFAEKDVAVGDVNATAWQLSSGGMALLPYGGDDLALSAKTADIGPALGVGLATDRLRTYFESVLADEKQDIHRRAIALYGLSALHELYLREVRQMAGRTDLTIDDSLYTALALDRLGATSEARALWARDIQPQIDRRENQASLKGGSDEDVSVRTALAAWLAAGLQHSDADALMNFVQQYPPTKTLVDIERYGWARDSLPRLRPGPVAFSYTTEGKTERVTLDKNQTFSLNLNSAQLAALRFSSVDGRVGVVTTYTQAADADLVRRDASVGISRRYLVNSAPTTTFREGDVIEVELTPNYSRAPVGAYEITDFLPSGLRALQGPPPGGYRTDDCVAWPLQVSDQRISLFSYYSAEPRYNRCRTVSYYARVVSKGAYRAEPALIQKSGEPTRQNVSASASVTIQ